MLRARRETSSISKFHFQYQKEAFECIDVGGQDYYRATWKDEYSVYYKELFAILFVVNLLDYSDPLTKNNEGKLTNRLFDSFNLMKEVATFQDNINVPVVTHLSSFLYLFVF